MKILSMLLVGAILLPAVALGQSAVVVVRHAERVDSSVDSPLSPAGEDRAVRLAAMLKDAGLTHIFTTELQRTIQTAAPAARGAGLAPQTLKSTDTDGLVAAVRAAGPQANVLVVGHSNTLPAILRRLGVTTPVAVDDTDFGNVFVVFPETAGAPRLLHLRY